MKTIQTILDEFEKEFCNNHQKPIRFLRSIFYDEQDGAEQIKFFLRQALIHQLDELKGKVDGCQEIYTSGSRKGEVKEHTDSCCNETISDILTIIDSMK